MKRISLIFSLLFAIFSAVAHPAITAFGVRPEDLHSASVDVNDALVTTMGAHKPEYRDFLVKTFGKQGHTFYDTLMMMGYTSTYDGVAQTNFSHFEEGYYIDYAAVLSTVADAGPGNPITIPINPTSVLAGQIYARPGDNVQNTGNGAQGQIISITGTAPNFSIVIQPTVAGVSFGGVTANDQLFIYSNGFAEETDQPRGRASQVTQFTFGAKIVKETCKGSNTELTNGLWFELDGSNVYMSKAIMDTEYRLKQYISNAALIDEPVTDTTSIGLGLRNMTGLLPYITNYGYTRPYISNTFSINDLRAIGKQQIRAFAGKEHMFFMGINLADEVGTAIGGLYKENPTIFSKRNGDWGYDNTKDVDLGFDSITMAGTKIKYHLNTMEIFSHPKGMGLPGYLYEGLGVMVPNQENTDPVTKGSVPNVQFRHKEKDGYSRKQRVWWTGGASKYANNSTVDLSQMNMLSELGIEIYAGNQFYQVVETA
jgi:hypothetical protein